MALETRENFVIYRTIESPTVWQIQQTSGSWMAPLRNGLRYVSGQKNHKGLHGVRIRKRMVGGGMERNGLDPTSGEEAVYLDVGYFSSW